MAAEFPDSGPSLRANDAERMAASRTAPGRSGLVFLLEVRPGGSTPRYRCAAASRAWLEAFGLTGTHVVGRAPEEFLPPRVAAQLLERSDDALRTEETVSVHLDTEVDGMRIRLATILEPILDGSGVCTHLLGIARDLEDPVIAQSSDGIGQLVALLEGAEEARARSEATLRAIVQHSPLPIYAVDRDGVVQVWSRACEQLFGWTEDEVVGSQVPFVPERGREGVDSIRARTFAGEILRDHEVPTRRKDGTWVDVSISSAPIRDSTGRIVTVMDVVADVTDRTRAEAALRASEERFRSLTEHSSELVTVLDANSRFAYLGPSAAAFLGVDPIGALGRPTMALVHPDDVESTQATFADLSESGGATPPFQLRLRHCTGEWRWVEVIATNLLDDPNVAGIVTNARDVTEHREAEDALREINEAVRQSNETLSAIVENSPLGILAFGSDGRIQLWNPACEEMSGWAAIEVLGRTAIEVLGRPASFLDRDDIAQFDAVASRVFAGEVVTGIETRRLRRDGTPFDVSFSAAPMRNEDGEVSAVLGVIADVTAQKAAQAAVGESEARFRTLVQHSSDIVAVVEPEGTIRYVSPSCERILGYEPAELAGRSPFELLHPEDLPDTERLLDEGLSREGVSEPVEVRFRHADGSWRQLEVQSNNLIDDPAVGGFVVTARDVTERHAVVEAVRKSEERLSALVQNLSDMITIIDRDGTIRWSSSATERLLGYTQDGVVSSHPLDHVHPDDVERVQALIRGLRPLPDLGAPIQFRVRHADGSWREVEAVASDLLDDPAVEGTVLTTRDVTERERSARELAASEARFRAIVEDQTELVYRYGTDRRVSFVNEACARYYETSGEKLIGRTSTGMIPAEDEALIASMIGRLGPEHPVESIEHRVIRPDGEVRWHQWTHRAVLDDDGRVVEYQAVGRDVTERREAEAMVAAQARILELIAKGARLPETLGEMCRVVEEHLPGSLCSVLLASDDGLTLRVGAAPSLPTAFVRDTEVVPIGPTAGSSGTAAYRGEPVVVGDIASDPLWDSQRDVAMRNGLRACWATPIHTSGDGPMLGAVSIYWREPKEPSLEHEPVVDLVVNLAAVAIERRNFEARLAHQAHHDPLTALPNRLLFYEFLMLALARSRRYRSTIAVLFLDLDRFKVVNDSLGHDAGDSVLRQVGGRLQSVVRPGDTISRFGGDEFTILCEDLSGPQAKQQAIDVAERLLDAIHRPFLLAGDEVFLSASIGIALAGSAQDRPDALLRDADAAMYRAKERGKGRWELFDEAMRATAMQRLATENALHRALDRREFRIFYQPVVSLREGRCTGAEALLRWQHPERGLVAPHEFIHLAEETGLIVPLGLWVLDEACEQAARWQAESRTGDRFVVRVNLSGRQLAQPDLVEQVAVALQRSGAQPATLCLEITESVLMDDADTTIGALRSLKGLGVRLSIDDFGTGYSSLGYLKRFPVDSVKVDRSFVDGLGTDPGDSAIVAAVVHLGHALGLRVVAEGVETEGQISELVSLGCDDAQGFFFAPPQPATDLTELVSRARPWRPVGAG